MTRKFLFSFRVECAERISFEHRIYIADTIDKVDSAIEEEK